LSNNHEKEINSRPIIRFKKLSKSFGDAAVLRELELDIAPAEKVAIIGASGSGKTTLLRMLMTLEKPDSGKIEVDNELLWHEEIDGKLKEASEKHLAKMRSKIGMIFQLFNLFPHMKVLRNVTEAPIHVLGLQRDEAEERAKSLLSLVGLSDKLDAYPSQLSGGQKQRVAIARALAMRPKIMLFDEVTSALDPELVGEVLNVIRKLAHDTQMTMLLVTHEMNFAREVSDRIVFINEGQVLEDASPEIIFSNPKHPRTREFLKAVNQH
jgi:polar amino acid transport system ATP-binding protein